MCGRDREPPDYRVHGAEDGPSSPSLLLSFHIVPVLQWVGGFEEFELRFEVPPRVLERRLPVGRWPLACRIKLGPTRRRE
jgi:hypothetical protein